jgi:2-keto-4-pentenoate hydratase/2-oxohepta-3-ene-1,7-dioic acid hydratase in catechol pathway
MRFANHDGRLALVTSAVDDGLDGARAVDLHDASGGQIPCEPELAYERWDEVLQLAGELSGAEATTIDRARLGSPSPQPRQIFGIGVNYADHGDEAGMEIPEVPLVFTKLSTSVTGPYGTIQLSTETVDWEVEIAVIIGKDARDVPREHSWAFVAGITAGQDLSDRDIQWRPPSSPQFTLGKSLAGFAPLGPILVTPDEYPDRDDIELTCLLNGEEVQHSTSAQMLLSIPEIISYLSGILTLRPGDVIFTGTPSGIGMTRKPPRYLEDGDTLESFVAGVGSMSHTFAAVRAQQQA